MVRSLVEATVLLVVVLLVWLPLRRRMSSQLAYGLFLLVLVKAAVPMPVPVRMPAALGWLAPERPADAPARVPAAPRGRAMPAAVTEPTIVVTPAAAPPVRVPRPALTGKAMMMVAWGMLVLLLSVRFAWVHAQMGRRLRTLRPLDRAGLPVDMRRLERLCGLKQEVPLLATPLVAAPAVWGLWRPRVLVPPDLFASLPPGPLSWVLLHELVHIRRGDAWVVVFQRLVQIVYLFNPAVWVANRLIDVQRELACDDAALGLVGDVSRRDCGAGFLAMVERSSAAPARATPALGMFGSRGFVQRRLMRILDARHEPRPRLSVRSAAVLVAAALVTLPSLRAQRADPPAPVTGGRTLEFRVVDARTDQPLPGVRLAVSIDRTHSDATTDETGRYTIRQIPATVEDSVVVRITHKGFASKTIWWRNEAANSGLPGSCTVKVVPVSTIGGVIHDEAGKPIAGATVYVRADSRADHAGGEEHTNLFDFPATTDAAGRWTCDRVPEDAASVETRLVHPDYASDSAYTDTPEPPLDQLRHRTAVMVMKRGATISGTVRDGSGKPIAGARVKLGIDRWGGPERPSTATDSDGRYRINVEPGSHVLTVVAEGYAPDLKRLPAVQRTEQADFTLGPGRIFQGRFVDPEGRPIAEVRVARTRGGGAGRWRTSASRPTPRATSAGPAHRPTRCSSTWVNAVICGSADDPSPPPKRRSPSPCRRSCRFTARSSTRRPASLSRRSR